MTEQIGENIRRIRHQRGLTQAELGFMVGIPDSTIRKYELGIVTPRSKRLKTIADVLEVNVEALKNTKIDEMTAIHRLFQLFCQYDGVFDQTEGIHFQKLDLKAWRERWILYQSDLKEAEKIVDEKERRRAMKEVEGSFDQWMDEFH